MKTIEEQTVLTPKSKETSFHKSIRKFILQNEFTFLEEESSILEIK